MDISIIIVNHRSWKPLEVCLDSISEITSPKLKFEVIIVDNFSNDGLFDHFVNKYSNFIFIKNNSNTGFSNGCNIGAKNAKGSYLFFLNTDTTISLNALSILYETYKKYPEIGILSCLQIDKKNHYFNQKKIFPSFTQVLGITRFFYRKLNKKRLQKKFNTHDNLFYPDWVTGSVIFISKDWFQKVNEWDDDYWLYFEDVAICKKIAQNKGKIAVTRDVTIFHEHGGASRIDFETECISKTEVIISNHVYINNHFNSFNKNISHFLLIIGILSEKIILSFLSLFLFLNLKLKTNKYILRNLCLYYYNATKKQTWLSPRSVNYQK
ncbi:glycosyltransferase family 2 protein [Flavobacterium taihuense]|uniref:Glycosyltransferase family 2 protein n=1 Tax=Flavobacterium taihuense TaxID=2857508 RepID=A0ABS6XVS7_9FLAO|nr:glycosyltransferase family 2 protein [Flavobacterium taihuense]MBW4360780.1 glycosyltransferase family 2 protein [Flavobacterium taihuense]